MPETGKRLLICFVLAATASGSVAADFSGGDGFFASFGSEYQYISQEYYNALLDTTTLDVIEIWQLDQDEINDFIFETNLGYRIQKALNRLYWLADLEISGDRLLGRTESFYRFGDYDNHFKLFGKFESKSPSDDNKYRAEDYNYFESYLSGRKRLNQTMSLDFKARFEQVVFDKIIVVDGDPADADSLFPSYDYSLFSGWIGGEFSLSELTSEIFWKAGYSHRMVPDSTRIEYDQFRLDIGYTYFSLKGMVNLEGDLELRDYQQPLGRDDFWALVLRGQFTRTVGNRYEIGGNLISDLYQYEKPDIVNRDYFLFRSELNGTIKFNGFDWGPMVRLELRDEEVVEDDEIGSIASTYNQWETGLHSNFLSRKALFYDGEVTYGSRSYNFDTGGVSSYNFWSVSVLANYSVYKGISLNFMFDALFESHEEKSDDTNLILLSIGVSARI